MPFRRRVPLSWKDRIHDWVWPRIGLRRALRLNWYRLRRLPGTPGSIAAGFGWGLGVAMNPVIGSHMILGAIGARLTGGNIIAAVIGTFVVNPWTAPPIWFATYYTGQLMQGSVPHQMPGFVKMFRGLVDSVWGLNPQVFVDEVWPVLWPMILGSVPIGLVAGFTSYALLKPPLARLRAGSHHLLRKRLPHAHHKTPGH